jgi:hypothetical protein
MKKTSIYAVSLIFIAILLAFPVAVLNVHASTSWQGYVKPSFPDYAPNGMPDFDEKQDLWGPAPGTYTWCVPVAVANSLWWLDSEYESRNYSNPVAPPAISDHFNLVTAYGPWDDHSSSNVDPLVRNLALLMHTDGQGLGGGWVGTRWADVAPGIQAYLVQRGVDSLFEVHQMDFPVFPWIDAQVTQCQDVELFLEFWYFNAGTWIKTTNPNFESGHCVAVAGSNATTNQVLVSDPYYDFSAPAANSTVHNDAQYVSHDPYTTAQIVFPPNPPPPGYPPAVLELQNYLQQNGFTVDPNWHAFIRGAVATSPIPVHDVAVTNVTSAKTIIGKGYGGNITETAEDQGNFDENFNVTTYANSTATAIMNFNLSSGNSDSKICVWNTTGYGYGNYTINGSADIVPGETDVGDNNYTCGVQVHVGVPGDVSSSTPGVYDKVVNMKDIAYMVTLFNTKPPSPNWNPNADVNNDGVVNMKDIAIAVLNFSQHE